MTDFFLDIKQTSEILGPKKIDCLKNLFKEMDGTPPCVNKKRYRAKYPDQIKDLDDLESSAQLIVTKHDNTGSYYHLRSYAIPLINDAKAQQLLNLMCKIYEKLSLIYKDRLDENITKEDLLKKLNFPEKETLEALSYFRESHDVWIGWGDGFPYRNGSLINISEKVILKENFLEISAEHYRWRSLNQKNIDPILKQPEINIPDIAIEEKIAGRPSFKNQVLAAYNFLKKNNKINYTKTFKSHITLIRETIWVLNPSLNKSVQGLGDEVIRRNLIPLFNKEKSLNQPQK